MEEGRELTLDERIETGKRLIEATLEKYGLVLVVKPIFVPRDDGTWSVVVQSEVQIRTSNSVS